MSDYRSIYEELDKPRRCKPDGSWCRADDAKKSPTITRDVVTQLFYLLIRDHMPAGVLIKAISDLMPDGEEDTVVYTNEQMRALAAELASRLE